MPLAAPLQQLLPLIPLLHHVQHRGPHGPAVHLDVPPLPRKQPRDLLILLLRECHALTLTEPP